MDIYFTGIGSRDCPKDVLIMAEKIGKILAQKGLILRSGAAEGFDSAIETGCDSVGGKKEIYLPWPKFMDHKSELFNHHPRAEEIAFQYHPNLYSQNAPVVKLMTRNSHQVLGKDMKTKSKFIVCYCPVDKNGVPKGGTSQAIRVAEGEGNGKIKIFNLFFKEQLEDLKKYIKELEVKQQNT